MGGRIHSIPVRDGSEDNIELGAMRFQSHQPIISQLIKTLNLSTKKFPESGNEYYSLRGAQLTEFSKMKWGQGYEIESSLAGYSPEQIIEMVAREIPKDLLPTSNHMPSEIAEKRGFIDFALTKISREALQLCIDADGYDSNFRNSQIVEAIKYHQRHSFQNVESRRILPSSQALPEALYRQSIEQSVKIQPSSRATRIFPGNDKIGIDLLLRDKSKLHKVNTNQVICTIPPRGLETIEFSDEHQRILNKNFESLIVENASRIVFLYPKTWWAEMLSRNARVVTDGPLRTILFSEMKECSTITFNMEYDIKNLDTDSKLENYITTALDQILRVESPKPTRIIKKIWEETSSRCAYHSWQAGADVEKVSSEFLKPFADAEIYFCGEAFSTQQSWIEGALESADRMLKKHFGLPRLLDMPSIQ